jgi:DNA-directed RNA polymerase specialized sigma24 family protein
VSDADLLTAARDGDKAALEKLLARHQAQVYRFGMKMCCKPEYARDVLQETLLAMARGLRDFRGAPSISTYLACGAQSDGRTWYCRRQARSTTLRTCRSLGWSPLVFWRG